MQLCISITLPLSCKPTKQVKYGRTFISERIMVKKNKGWDNKPMTGDVRTQNACCEVIKHC